MPTSNHEFVVVIKLIVSSDALRPKPSPSEIRRAFEFWLDGNTESLTNPLTGNRVLNNYRCARMTGVSAAHPRSEVLRIIGRPNAAPSV